MSNEYMSQTAEYFERNGYVVLKEALDSNQCNVLTKHMLDLGDQGKLVNDDQCPLSGAVYGDSLFDNLLVKFAKPIGDSVGRTLIPTYSYARVYKTGEILKRHKDRPACEISATLTLGFDSKPIWPIFFDEEKEATITLERGEMAVYKGCEVLHWRTPFKGQWHVQVFLHYVDANGPYKEHAMDGRESFGIQKNQNVGNDQAAPQKPVQQLLPAQSKFGKPRLNSVIIPSSDNTFPGYFSIDRENLPELRFTPQECQRIIGMAEQFYPSTASVGGSADNSVVSKQTRAATIYVLENDEENEWIYDKISNIVSIVNTLYFDYDISGMTHGIQLIEYSSDADVKGHYDWHVNAGKGEPSHRKISLTAQLSDPSDYTECNLIINNHGHEVIATRERGSVHLFPSYMPHKVSSIAEGKRYALVIWIHGPRRFK